MFKLVICDDESRTTVVPLVRDEISIGRKEGNTIRLTERNISRRHAKLVRENGAYTVEDVNSYNGIRVNGIRVKGRSALKHGDEVLIGDYKLSLLLDGADTAAGTEQTIPMEMPPEAATAMIAAPREPVPPARLVMISPPSPGAEFALSRPRMRLGRAEDLDVSVNHRSVSREHAEIVREGDSFKVTDLGSANGLRVNSQEVQQAELRPGDVLELGQVRFRYVGHGEHYRFDADQTIQMDAVRIDDRSRAPLVVGILLILVAIVLATLLALAGEERPSVQGSSDPFATSGTGTDPATDPVAQLDAGAATEPTSPTPPTPPTTPQDQVNVAHALSTADTYMAAERWADAEALYDRVLAQEPDNQAARRGKTAAASEREAQAAYIRGHTAYELGNRADALQAFQQIPRNSFYRSQTDVGDVVREHFRREIGRAQSVLQARPAQAAAIVRDFVGDRALEPSEQQRASRLLSEARRRAGEAREDTPGAPETPPDRPTPTPPSTPTPPTPPAEDLGSRVRECTNSACYVRVLEGQRGLSARLLRLRISSLQSVGRAGDARRDMAEFVRRFPDDRTSLAYRQVLGQTRGQ
ncbi:MAG: FHA domain-containing protein [Deltaproteobacteria bacterium]|nr:FHA domain-containing protein [Deltaproteobacteria bacterium]